MVIYFLINSLYHIAYFLPRSDIFEFEGKIKGMFYLRNKIHICEGGPFWDVFRRCVWGNHNTLPLECLAKKVSKFVVDFFFCHFISDFN